MLNESKESGKLQLTRTQMQRFLGCVSMLLATQVSINSVIRIILQLSLFDLAICHFDTLTSPTLCVSILLDRRFELCFPSGSPIWRDFFSGTNI